RFNQVALATASATVVGLPSMQYVSMASDAFTANPNRTNKVKYCLNTSTIHGEVVPILEQVAIAQKAGYDAIEFWLRDINKYVSEGGTLPDLKKRITDAGLTVESAIAFANWIVDDEEARKKGLEQARKDMAIVTAIGGIRIAAPPAGATQEKDGSLHLDQAGERYRALLEIGKAAGCIPQLEVWGFSKNLSKLSEVLYVAAAAQHPDACVLPDIYHLYKGGSSFNDLMLLSGRRIHVFHMNDYPEIPREKINDADRVYPGDGIAPVAKILSTVFESGFDGILSLELFNRTYWQQDPNVVAAKGLASMKLAVSQAK
ncbi:MAG TPA: sugar phosphate isomerase/epimerase family protein, partial [Pirellula sp.]|nr:sugar phosphate isomerase/epimerase family protein [Pirellula sp.]